MLHVPPSTRRPFLAVLLFLSAACTGGGGGGTTGPGPGGGVLSETATFERPASLVAAVAGDGEVRVDWTLPERAGYEVGLFAAPNVAVLYAGAPVATTTSATTTTLGAQANGVPVVLGLGVRPLAGGAWTPTGVVLGATPGPPIYVDASASPTGADGTTPATAFPEVVSALATAQGAGGGNVWVRGGSYAVANLPLFAGVRVYGGFDGTFALAARNPVTNGTTFVASGSAAVGVQGGEPAAVLSGLALDGSGGAAIGIDLLESELELHGVRIQGFADRGVRARNVASTDCFDLRIVDSLVSANGADGVNVVGAFDVFLSGSRFVANAQEGIECGPLLAPDASSLTLVATGCRFSGNGADGLDVDLAAPGLPGPNGATFTIDVRGCTFESNGLEGLLVDLDFEGVPGWYASVLVRESLVRANGGAGLRIDADAAGDFTVHRVTASANRGDGVWVSSESYRGIALVSACALLGNVGAGLRANLGNVAVCASHCVFGGNAGGGFASEVLAGTTSSCVFASQPTPTIGTVQSLADVTVDAAVDASFAEFPEGFFAVNSGAGTAITLADASALDGAAVVVLDDDDVARGILGIAGNEVTLDAASATAPATLAAYAPGAAGVDDYAVVGGSSLVGAGLALGGDSIDAGPVAAAGTPGLADPVAGALLRPLAVSPAPGVDLGAMATLTLTFSADVDGATVAAGDVRAVDGAGTPLAANVQVVGADVSLDPPGGGWPATVRVEVFRGLASTGGAPVAASFHRTWNVVP